jgi:hypothetical protein
MNDAYVNDLRASGIGYLPLYGGRWTPFRKVITFRNINLTGATLSAQVRLSPDANGAAFATFATSGFTFSGVDSFLTLTLSEGQMTTMPAASSTGKNAVLYWDIHITYLTVKEVWLAGEFTVVSGVTRV